MATEWDSILENIGFIMNFVLTRCFCVVTALAQRTHGVLMCGRKVGSGDCNVPETETRYMQLLLSLRETRSSQRWKILNIFCRSDCLAEVKRKGCGFESC